MNFATCDWGDRDAIGVTAGSNLARRETWMSFRSVKNKLVPERLVSRNAIFATLASIAIVLTGLGSEPANAENPDITSRRASERTDFTNDEIKDGFFKIAFNAELQLGAPAERSQVR